MDRFPDEILIIILSCLTLKEAVRTSVLSRRWRYLWRFMSGSLELDLDRWNGNQGHWTKAREFRIWVDQVVKLHQGPSIEKFIVRSHGMGHDNADSLFNWIHFALRKEVRVFELDTLYHNFPDLDKFLSVSSAIKSKPIGFSSLTSFKLVGVSIKDHMMEYLLSNCPRLEHLYIRTESHLKNLNVVSPSLKSLVMYFCTSLEILTISAANLVSFEYGEGSLRESRELDLQFKDIPLLSELKLNGKLCNSIFFCCQSQSEYSHLKHQLEKLHLSVPYTVVIPSATDFTHSFVRLPQLQCLKQLELVLEPAAGECLLFFVLLTMSCPMLSRLHVELTYCWAASEEEIASTLHGYKHAQEGLTTHHHHLKVVKLINFAFFKSDFRFALALLQIAKSLEKMIIKPGSGRMALDSISTRERRFLKARERAKQLEASLPHGAELLML